MEKLLFVGQLSTALQTTHVIPREQSDRGNLILNPHFGRVSNEIAKSPLRGSSQWQLLSGLGCIGCNTAINYNLKVDKWGVLPV